MVSRLIVHGSPEGFLWHLEVVVGLILVMAGILIAVFPAILVALISTLIILGGVALIGAGLRMRRLLRYQRNTGRDIIDV
jgi:hypothetical protein